MSQNAFSSLTLFFFAYTAVLLFAIFFIMSFSTLFFLGSYSKETSSLYFTNLIFSMFGCLGALVFLSLSSPIIGLSICTLATIAISLNENRAKVTKSLTASAYLAIVILFVLVFSATAPRTPGIVFEKWTPFSKITVTNVSTSACWRCANNTLVDSYTLTIDYDASTSIFKNVSDAPVVRKDVTHIGYYLLGQNSTVVILGSGGGRDVLGARTFFPKRIVAIEINPTIVEATNSLSPSIYGNPDTQVIVDDGRAGLLRMEEKADIIQLSLVDTWAASNSGSYALVENYLYTRESLSLYLDRLSDSGIVSITRWTTDKSRLTSLALAALSANGIQSPLEHVLLISARGEGEYGLITALIKKSPFTQDEYGILSEKSAELGFEIERPEPPIVPNTVSDDSPFFFFTSYGLVMLLLMSLPLIIGGAILLRIHSANQGFHMVDALFFSAIGLGFMLIEFLVLQKGALIIQNPTMNFGLSVGVLLAGSGLGSFFSSKIKKLIDFTVILPLLLLAFMFIMNNYSVELALLDLPLRILIMAILVVPIAFLMGVFFPPYFDRMKKRGDSVVGLAWAANGFFSVLSPTIGLMISIYLGFNTLAIAACIVYATATVLLLKITRQ